MLTLGVDTSSPATSIAILCGRDVLASFHEEHDHPPSDTSFVFLEELLQECGFKLSDMELFAACRGPGSFTGLRIGLGMVKTFAMALNRPVLGVDGVTILASQVLLQQPDRKDDFVCALAGFKNTAFAGRYQVRGGQPQLKGDLMPLDGHETFVDWLESGEEVFLDPAISWAIPGAGTVERRETAAVTLARLAQDRADRNLLPAFDEVQPLYLRAFSVGRKARRPEDLR